jgi:hypothetical protein
MERDSRSPPGLSRSVPEALTNRDAMEEEITGADITTDEMWAASERCRTKPLVYVCGLCNSLFTAKSKRDHK